MHITRGVVGNLNGVWKNIISSKLDQNHSLVFTKGEFDIMYLRT